MYNTTVVKYTNAIVNIIEAFVSSQLDLSIVTSLESLTRLIKHR